MDSLGDLTQHSRNCKSWLGVYGPTGPPINDSDCNCALFYRIWAKNEQELHNAWEKRAYEAEAEIATLQSQLADRDRLLGLWKRYSVCLELDRDYQCDGTEATVVVMARQALQAKGELGGQVR